MKLKKTYSLMLITGMLSALLQAQPTGKFGGGNAAGYAHATFSSSLALYVELSDFSAKAEEAAVRLQWRTQREWQNSHFEVERSADGRQFKTIGWLSGAGNQQTESLYDFRDVAPLEGRNYYRIKDVDWNGRSHFSEVKAVFFSRKNELNVFPNPTVGEFFLHVPATLQVSAFELKVYSLSGQEILRKQFPAYSPKEIGPLKLPESLSGLYIIRLIGENQSWSHTIEIL